MSYVCVHLGHFIFCCNFFFSLSTGAQEIEGVDCKYFKTGCKVRADCGPVCRDNGYSFQAAICVPYPEFGHENQTACCCLVDLA